MRHRSGFLALAALISFACSAAPAAAEPPRGPAAPVDSAPSAADVLALPAFVIASTESVHVYLITQLAVPAAVAADSVALQQLVAHSGLTIWTAFQGQHIPVFRIRPYLKETDSSASEPPSAPSDPSACNARRLNHAAAWTPRSSTPYMTVAVLSRRR